MTYENFVQVQLAAPLGSSDTTLTLANPTGAYRLPPATGGILVLADSVGSPAFTEIVSYASRSGNTLSGLTRGQEGTSARAWPAGTFCYQSLTAGDFANALGLKAPLESPAFTGNPTAPTPAATDTDTSIATTAFVRAAMGLFGLGANTPDWPKTTLNDFNVPTGFYRAQSSVIDTPFTDDWGVAIEKAPDGAYVRQSIWCLNGATRIFERVISSGVAVPWRELFHTGNILGTVSQAGGVPTGAIIERGSNANGSYVRLADGTQECWTYKTATVGPGEVKGFAFTNAVGFVSEVPLSFASVSPEAFTLDIPWGMEAHSANGATIYVHNNNPAARNVAVFFRTIGRWF